MKITYCTRCKKSIEITNKNYNKNVRRNGSFICQSCRCRETLGSRLPLDKIKELWSNGDGATRICAKLKLQCHKITISRLAKLYRWERVNHEQIASNLIIQKGVEVLRLFDSGIQASEISRRLDLNYINLRRFLRRNGRDTASLHYTFNRRDDIRKQRAMTVKKLWRAGRLNNIHLRDPRNIEKSIIGMKKKWEDPDFRRKMSEVARLRWYRDRTWEKMNKFKDTKPELAIKQILELLNVPFKRNFFVGSGFTVDFYLPEHNLLLDVDGEYWHGRFRQEHRQIQYVVEKDNRKNKYIGTLPYKYSRLWESMTLSREALISVMCRLLNKTVPSIDYDFKALEFVKCTKPDEAKTLIESFHYSGCIGPYMGILGAKLGERLIAVCVWKYPTYNTNAGRVELSRFCIHPSYQKKNAASYLLSRFIKMIDVREVITYADTTQGHDGTIYKAANFESLSQTTQSYYYIDEYNSKYHKKTIYNQAHSLKMSERDYAEKVGLIAITEKPKVKFLYKRRI